MINDTWVCFLSSCVLLCSRLLQNKLLNYVYTWWIPDEITNEACLLCLAKVPNLNEGADGSWISVCKAAGMVENISLTKICCHSAGSKMQVCWRIWEDSVIQNHASSVRSVLTTCCCCFCKATLVWKGLLSALLNYYHCYYYYLYFTEVVVSQICLWRVWMLSK